MDLLDSVLGPLVLEIKIIQDIRLNVNRCNFIRDTKQYDEAQFPDSFRDVDPLTMIQPRFVTSSESLRTLIYFAAKTMFFIHWPDFQVRRYKGSPILKVAEGTILDGELSIDRKNHIVATYIAYDCFHHHQQPQRKKEVAKNRLAELRETHVVPILNGKWLFYIAPLYTIYTLQNSGRFRPNQSFWIDQFQVQDFLWFNEGERTWCVTSVPDGKTWNQFFQNLNCVQLLTMIQKWREHPTAELEIQFLKKTEGLIKWLQGQDFKKYELETIDFFYDSGRYTQQGPDDPIVVMEKTPWHRLVIPFYKIQLKNEKLLSVTQVPVDETLKWVRVKQRTRYIQEDKFAYDVTQVYSGSTLAQAMEKKATGVPELELELELMRTETVMSMQNEILAVDLLQQLSLLTPTK